jgi:hypothetical protein
MVVQKRAQEFAQALLERQCVATPVLLTSGFDGSKDRENHIQTSSFLAAT